MQYIHGIFFGQGPEDRKATIKTFHYEMPSGPPVFQEKIGNDCILYVGVATCSPKLESSGVSLIVDTVHKLQLL